MKTKSLILFGLLILTKVLNAQTDFRPGYVIKLSGDTLYGTIDYQGDLLMSRICKFKSIDNTISEYSPNDIKAFRFIDSKYYVSRDINGKGEFLEYLINGKVNIYYMLDDKGDHYFMDKENLKLTELPYKEGTKDVDGKQVYYQTTQHIGFLAYYMQDAPKLKSRIEDVKEPEHHRLIKLAEDYHNAVCEGTKCIIYEKNLPIIKIIPELTGGVLNYSNVLDLNDKFYFQMGIIADIWMPRTSEKLYFRTGILYSTLEAHNVKKTIYKIPIQFEYMYPKGIIRPIVAFGINIYSPFYQSVALMGGVNIKLYKSLYLGLNYDIDFNIRENSPLFPKSILSQSILAGLIVKI